MNWRGDGVAACRSAGSHPPAASASPLWHARHPLARGPRPAIPSQGSNQVCRPADSVVTLLRDTDSVPRVTGERSCKPSDRAEWGAHRGYYKPARCMKSSNSFAWVRSPGQSQGALAASCPLLAPLGHATLALEVGKSSGRRCQKAKPYNFVSGVALKGRKQKVLLLPSLLSWLYKLCFTSRLFCSLSTSREASLLYFKTCFRQLFLPRYPQPLFSYPTVPVPHSCSSVPALR